jgi:catechol 2,3-dioxygenase
LYLDDPDKNGVELYWDRPMEEWPISKDGSLEMYTKALNIDTLLKEMD